MYTLSFITNTLFSTQSDITNSDTGSGSCSLTVNEGGSDREVYEEMKRLYRILGATVIQVTPTTTRMHCTALPNEERAE